MKYVRVSQEEGEQMLNKNDMYKYMPVIVCVENKMVRIVGQDDNGNAYYIEEV